MHVGVGQGAEQGAMALEGIGDLDLRGVAGATEGALAALPVVLHGIDENVLDHASEQPGLGVRDQLLQAFVRDRDAARRRVRTDPCAGRIHQVADSHSLCGEFA